MKFEIRVLGAGGALSTSFNNSNFLFRFSENGEKWFNYLFDAGITAPAAFSSNGAFKDLTQYEPDGLLITHTHGDHANSVEYFGFRNRYILNRPIALYANNAVWEMLWNKTLDSMHYSSKYPEEFFDVKTRGEFPRQFDKAEWVKTIHITPQFPTYGLSFKVGNLVMFISGDTQFRPSFFDKKYWQKAYGVDKPHLILHEVQFYENDPAPVHTLYSELCSLPDDIRERMVLYHYSGITKDVVHDGFKGYLPEESTTGQKFFEFDTTTGIYKMQTFNVPKDKGGVIDTVRSEGKIDEDSE